MIIPAARTEHLKSRQNFSAPAIAALLLLAGLYFPTSISGNIAKPLNFANYAICFALLGMTVLTSKLRHESSSVVIALSIVPLLLLFSLSSGMNSYTPGALAGYLVFSLLCCCNLQDIDCPPWLERVYLAVNVLNVAAGFAILIGNSVVGDFIVNHYSVYYPDLVINMLAWHKPVLTFGTHSLAAFYFYLLFYGCIRGFEARRKYRYLLLAISYLLLTFGLLSLSGLLLATVGTVQLLWSLWLQDRRLFLFAALVTMGLPTIFGYLYTAGQSWSAILSVSKAIITEPDSGWLGRFGGGGYMQYDLRYLRDNPLSPVGITYREEMMFGDSGVVEHLLRGSVVLLGVVYLGFFLFLKRNVLRKADRWVLLVAILAFEVGYSTLLAVRTLCLLPFFVIYLNGLCQPQTKVS